MTAGLAALILPLCLDTFAVSAALGVAPLTRRQRWRLTGTFALAEAGMSLLGYGLGSVGSALTSGASDLVAAGVLAGTGLLLLHEGEEDHPEAAASLHGWAFAAAAIAVSVDELAIGVTIGLLRLPVVPVALLIGLQAILASFLGLRLGSRFGKEIGEQAERAAGVLLLLLALGLVIVRVKGG